MSKTNLESYKALVDLLVQVAGGPHSEARIKTTNRYMRWRSETREKMMNSIFSKITDNEKEFLEEHILQFYPAAIHDLAAKVDAMIELDNLKISWKGGTVEDSPLNRLHHDFSARMDGITWKRLE